MKESQEPSRSDIEALKHKLEQDERILAIDVREDNEVKSGSIPGSIHIPLGMLEQRMQDIPKDVELVFF